jgi:hypothetical protein
MTPPSPVAPAAAEAGWLRPVLGRSAPQPRLPSGRVPGGSLSEIFHPHRWVETRFGMLVLAVVCLSAFDAGSTLYLMGTGLVDEANPFMRVLIEYDPMVFALWKQWMTGGCLIVAACLARHRTFGVLEGRVILRVAFTGYLILAGWHLFLISLTRIA